MNNKTTQEIIRKLNGLKILQVSVAEQISNDFPEEYRFIFQNFIESCNLTVDDEKTYYYITADFIYKFQDDYVQAKLVYHVYDADWPISQFDFQVKFKQVYPKQITIFTDEI